MHAYGPIDCMLTVRSIACLRSDRLHAWSPIDCVLAVRSIACLRSDRLHAYGLIDCMRVMNAWIRVQENRQAGRRFALPELPALLFVFAMVTGYSMVRGRGQAGGLAG